MNSSQIVFVGLFVFFALVSLIIGAVLGVSLVGFGLVLFISCVMEYARRRLLV